MVLSIPLSIFKMYTLKHTRIIGGIWITNQKSIKICTKDFYLIMKVIYLTLHFTLWCHQLLTVWVFKVVPNIRPYLRRLGWPRSAGWTARSPRWGWRTWSWTRTSSPLPGPPQSWSCWGRSRCCRARRPAGPASSSPQSSRSRGCRRRYGAASRSVWGSPWCARCSGTSRGMMADLQNHQRMISFS